jgi:predicted transcriptional regulator YdeE
MQKVISQLREIKLVGIKTRTNNKAEFEASTAKIPDWIQRYFYENIANKIPNRSKPGITYCAYTEYESDWTADYSYFIGEEVSAFDGLPEGLEKHIIPVQTYVKFTTDAGAMPQVVINAWQEIWQTPPKILGGQRNYHTDFEIYDERSFDQQNAIIDIYIGLKP